MELILCNTNLAVTTVVCQLAKEQKKKFVVFTDVRSIYDFLFLLSPTNMELHFVESVFSYSGYWRIIKSKRRVKDLIVAKHINKVYCYHQAFGGFYNWIIHYCARQNCEVIYYRILDNLVLPTAKNNLDTLKMKWIYKLLFSTDVKILDRSNHTYIPKLTNTFYQKNHIAEKRYSIDEIVINETAQTVINKLGIDTRMASVVLLTGSVMDTGQVKRVEYSEKISQLIAQIGGNRIVAKCHPRFTDETKEEKELLHLPSFIPMDFLLDRFDVFIGYNSTVLREAASKGKVAISLIECLTPVNVERRNHWYSYFEGSSIIFPKDITEISNSIK